MKYQTVLFDMDGTLLDTLTDMEAAVNHILTQYGYPVRTLEEVRRFVGNGAGLLIHRALPQGVDPAREAEVLDSLSLGPWQLSTAGGLAVQWNG